MISYAILVSDEDQEFNKLLTHLVRIKDVEDEIIVVADSSKTNANIKTILNNNQSTVTHYMRSLDGDFSAQKNFLFEKCNNEFIVNLDADEFVDETFIKSVKQILKSNPDIDAYWVPRWNEVTGITDDHIKMWGWKLDSYKRINWPDLQMRIVRNNSDIKWTGIVHEQITGYNTYAVLPLERDYSIAHIKTIEKQTKQNAFYTNMVKK
jgi:glycosyltransferase involved in cell wall biosynthesis